jgi:hypothetical protein
MQFARKLLVLTVAVGALAGCPSDPVAPPAPTGEWFGVIQGADGWEHLSGQSGFIWTEGATTFETFAQIEGDEVGAVRPWHVHENTCAAGGDIVGSDADYPRLVTDATGVATVVTFVPRGIDPNADYHVNIHLSVDEMETIIACGDLTLVQVF